MWILNNMPIALPVWPGSMHRLIMSVCSVAFIIRFMRHNKTLWYFVIHGFYRLSCTGECFKLCCVDVLAASRQTQLVILWLYVASSTSSSSSCVLCSSLEALKHSRPRPTMRAWQKGHERKSSAALERKKKQKWKQKRLNIKHLWYCFVSCMSSFS